MTTNIQRKRTCLHKSTVGWIGHLIGTIPAGTSKNDPSGDQANLRKKDGNVSS